MDQAEDDPMDLERCVFHLRTSANAEATELIPLSVLRERDHAAFSEAIAKYGDTPERRRLPKTRIPRTDATWIDVVFMSPIRPHAIWEAWRELTGTALAPQEFWAVPIDDLPDAVVLDRFVSSTGDAIHESEVTAFTREGYSSSAITTPGNRAWLEDLARRKRGGAWFHRTPHVLSLGSVPLDRARIVQWQDA
ncbi:hypothetical protein [Brachybacterium kimchii]|uniref:RES domain-containing protein n=1 Tax=Brachybacterium kimchii TaxID=2942909 RepID=A0ABY4N3F9_9MICO|nr:hypothetical protein [Brachybacterium kimchii]UQN29100.1 hypothetical protein M4486_15930 [Brachybacterium kimchii]